MMRGARRGCLQLIGAVIGIDDEDDSTFTITVDQKTFHFQARDAEEKEKWIDALEATILKHSQSHQLWPHQTKLSLADFDRRLSETDAYLQILIEQVKGLEMKIASCESEDAKYKYMDVKNSAENMIENIKQSIVLLQISKHITKEKFAHPHIHQHHHHHNHAPRETFQLGTLKPAGAAPQMNGQQQAARSPGGSRRKASAPPTTAANSKLHPPQSLQQQTLKEGRGPASSGPGSLSKSSEQLRIQPPSTQNNPAPQPATGAAGLLASADAASALSVSLPNLHRQALAGSVDDVAAMVPPPADVELTENNNGNRLFRAGRGSENDSSSLMLVRTPGQESSTSTIEDSASSSSEDDEDDFFDAEDGENDGAMSPPPVVIASEDDIFDELYDDIEEDQLESLDQHGSIITHLLSQVRIGMDLTKIVLPTFILEKRSLLEMYADFLAHPDLFVGIVDYKTPKERMVQCTRWYLSAFHAGRRSSVAKKPYNPIIGETFQCLYDLPTETRSTQKVEDGPIGWATRNNVSFIAEQVSHHPPISAFYAEHYNKRISLDGYIWTKSKFLGLSIGVHMIGQGVISLLDWDEEYVITFPNGYGRSILTVPWIELGGKCTITCAKTGYNATIDFQTKPFYGGKKDQICAEIFAPNEKKSFCTVKGEWNGVMFAKHNTGQNEVFVDTKNMPIVKKRVRSIEQQGDMESRRLWKEVTKALKEKNVEKATDGKRKLEQRQREEAKERKEKGQQWQTKFFSEVGEHWVYENPLVKRVKNSSSSTSNSS